jgi:deoxyribodipyrimidine photolyase-related protein
MANSTTACLVFPHQLFANNPVLQPQADVYLIEEWLFFQQYRFHRQKLVLHRASMKYYQAKLEKGGYQVKYCERTDVRELILQLTQRGVTELRIGVVTDNWLQKHIREAATSARINITWINTPYFLNTSNELQDYRKQYKRFFQTHFYTEQRKKRGYLLDAGGEPLGGKWTFDTDNRERYPKNQQPPTLLTPGASTWVEEAISYVEKHFPDAYGPSTPFRYAITHAAAEEWLHEFLRDRLAGFGPYEDAIVDKAEFLHHSVLTPMLNIGLLTPQQVIDALILYTEQHPVPLNSTEGFLRQVMGWREFIRYVYDFAGSQQRTKNYWGFERKIPSTFWEGKTGIYPIDSVIQKVLKTGYCHHIERLMVLGNFMLLCEFDPDEVHRWFMELFVDAYDWVMVPNVYGMTQFADGGMMTTKPYISGSNYLTKMSDYPKGDWQPIWDGLFWRFMHVHRDFFTRNPRLGMLVKTFDKMPETKQNAHIQHAETFLAQLDQQLPSA